jgi:signal transduction histidine kinase
MSRPRLRTRLALLHAALAFAGGVVLVAVVALGLFHGGDTTHQPAPAGNLGEVLRFSAVAVVVLALASIALGWLIAGRALRPLRAITRSARAMSASTLDGRLRVPAAYEEFADLADSLDGLAYRLHESFTAQRQFIANASHELRTPLTVQRTLLQLTLADPDATADTLRAACRDVLDLGRQQEHLIDALLTLATGQQGIDRWATFDLAEVTGNVVLDHPGVCSALVPVTVTGDPALAEILVTNLVTNAVRHNIPGGSVEVATTADGRLTVSNTGPLIPESEVERLLQPFQRLGADRTDQTDGHGLGLAIVAAIAHAHGAHLAVRPRPNGGLHVTVDFRRAA